jgi:hypothetical protein
MKVAFADKYWNQQRNEVGEVEIVVHGATTPPPPTKH